MVCITKNSKETEKIGEILGQTIKNGAIILLFGDLGAGKTAFVKGLAKKLGVNNPITSPTFLLIKKYAIKDNEFGIENFYHIDCYRAEDEKKLQFLGIEEILNDKKAVVAVEWPERIKKIIPKDALSIKFKWLNESERKITIAA